MSGVSIVSWHRKFVQSAHCRKEERKSKREREKKKSLTKFNLELCASVHSIRIHGPCVVVQLFRFVKTGFVLSKSQEEISSPTSNEFPPSRSKIEEKKNIYFFFPLIEKNLSI